MPRTYSPLPAWPVLGAATVLFLAPGYRAATCLGVLVSGYIVGPLVARALMSLPPTLADLPDDEPSVCRPTCDICVPTCDIHPDQPPACYRCM
jgi:hypothetical protein